MNVEAKVLALTNFQSKTSREMKSKDEFEQETPLKANR